MYFLCSLEVVGLFLDLLYVRCLRLVMHFISVVIHARLLEACRGDFAGNELCE